MGVAREGGKHSSPNSQDKITTFYTKALGRYGDGISCQDNAPVGTPTQTSEGLTCFSLVALDLPTVSGEGSGKSD